MVSNLPQREEYLRKKRKKKIVRWVIVLFLLMFIFGFSSYISHRPEFRITNVTLSGGVLVTQDDIQKESKNFLLGKYFWLYPKDNAFLYKRKDLRDYLKEKFKRIDTIDISLEEFQTLKIKITERKPYAIWCSNLVDTIDFFDEAGGTVDKIEECYFMDQDSAIFAPAPHFSGDAYFKYYGLVSTTTPIGSYYISSSTEFAQITRFIDRIKEIGVRPQYLISKEGDEFEVVINGGGGIYFDIKEPLDKVADNLEALLQTPELAGFERDKLPVDYIDLRFGNKLFYKLSE